jgi:nicotinamidase-related amidase
VTNTHVDEIDAKKTALVVVYMSKGIMQAGIGGFSQSFAEPAKRAGLVEKVARVADGPRAKGGVAVYADISYRPGHPETPPFNPCIRRARAHDSMLAGSKETEFADGLSVAPEDFVEHRTGSLGPQLPAGHAVRRMRHERGGSAPGIAENAGRMVRGSHPHLR